MVFDQCYHQKCEILIIFFHTALGGSQRGPTHLGSYRPIFLSVLVEAKSFQMQVQASKSGLEFASSEISCIYVRAADRLVS